MKRSFGLAVVALVAVGMVITAFAQSTGVNNQEIQRFVLPGTNTTGYRAHASGSELHITLPAGNIWAQGGYKVAYTYAHGDFLTANLSATAMPIAGTLRISPAGGGVTTGGVFYQKPPSAGYVVGVAISSSTALTAGAAHAEATVLIGGSSVQGTGLRTIIGPGETVDQYAAATQARDRAPKFRAGNEDSVGCRWATSANVAPSNAQIICTVIVEY